MTSTYGVQNYPSVYLSIHTPHWKRISFECVAICLFSTSLELKLWPLSSHVHRLSPELERMCVLKWDTSWKSRPHILHLSWGTCEWVRMWAKYELWYGKLFSQALQRKCLHWVWTLQWIQTFTSEFDSKWPHQHWWVAVLLPLPLFWPSGFLRQYLWCRWR